MKNIILIFSLFIGTSALGQEWKSGIRYLTATNAGWLVSELNVTAISGDTTYLEVRYEGAATSRGYTYFEDKLYNEENRLSFDFGLNEGDTLIYIHGVGDTCKVDSVRDRVLSDGNTYTHFYVYTLPNRQHHTVIKGVGGITYGLEPLNTITIPEYNGMSAICRNDEAIYWEIYENGMKTDPTCDFQRFLDRNSVKNQTGSSYSVYPNPTNSTLTIKNAPENAWYILYSLQGQEVETEVKDGVVDVTNLVPGVYILEIRTEGVAYQSRFIKE